MFRMYIIHGTSRRNNVATFTAVCTYATAVDEYRDGTEKSQRRTYGCGINKNRDTSAILGGGYRGYFFGERHPTLTNKSKFYLAIAFLDLLCYN